MKKFLYNMTPELVIIWVIVLLCIPLIIICKEAGILYCIILICFLGHVCWNFVINRDRSYLSCNHSIFSKNSIWINQKSFTSGNKDECPQYEFVKEMISMLKEIPDGTTCYCCTHELIKNHIIRFYHNAEVTPVYKKDLKRLKKKLKTKKCDICKSEKCTLLVKDKTQFYAIKFIK